MRIKLKDNSVIVVWFKKISQPNGTIATRCEMSFVYRESDPCAQCLVSATAFQHPRDRYDKFSGKKVSLTKAMTSLGWYDDTIDEEKPLSAMKAKRLLVWKEFMKQFGHLVRKAS